MSFSEVFPPPLQGCLWPPLPNTLDIGPFETTVLELWGSKGDTEPPATMEHLAHGHSSSALSLAAHPGITIACVQRLVCVSGNGVQMFVLSEQIQ